jgi:hypothetical protein
MAMRALNLDEYQQVALTVEVGLRPLAVRTFALNEKPR